MLHARALQIIRIALASVYQGTLAKLAEDVQDAYGELSLANRAAIKVGGTCLWLYGRPGTAT